MIFSSIFFVCCFLPVMMLLYYNPFLKSLTYKNTVLLLGSLAFYAWGEPVFVLVMIISIILNYIFGIVISANSDKIAGKIFFITAMSYNIGLLFVFKYLDFLLINVGNIFKKNMRIDLALPIGISFFTFQIISYIIDVYKDKVKAQKNILHLALYISMFPQLVAGPIVRYADVQDEIRSRKESKGDIIAGTYRFVYGLAKKVLLADYLGLIANNIFAQQSACSISVLSAWIGAFCYTLQIYYDFSGYSDMAIGLGRLFGFHFSENFNYPYLAKSITEFWRRWHISLSTWFRDYVYIPLGGSRCSRMRHVMNLLLVWTLTGIWHGANWNFILWGGCYAILLILEKYTPITQMPKLIAHVYTMFWVLILWVLFRAESLGQAISYIQNMFNITVKPLTDIGALQYIWNAKWLLAFAIFFCIPVKKWNIPQFILNRKNAVYIIEYLFTVVVFILTFAVCLKATYKPFIYFNF